jgi:hypothetical protein
MSVPRPPLRATLALAAVALLVMSACSPDAPVAPSGDDDWFDKSIDIVQQDGRDVPTATATVTVGDASLTFWPYTGTSYDATPVDPINVVFRGEVDPRRIREALLALDGDRTAFGLPDMPPFNMTWRDALGGDVQTTFIADQNRWAGSVIQLTLGDYGPLRFHLRLFRTCAADDGGAWTLGGAHFEMQIPGTTNHQVLSWEMAEQLVVLDMMRTGLLDADLPALPSGVINDTPTFRDIPAEIYNLLPPELVALIGGPAQPVDAPVPLPSDGEATVLQVVTAAPITPGSWRETATVEFGQLVPRPFCSEGPGDLLYITGPVDFVLDVRVNGQGHYRVDADYAGELSAQPMTMTVDGPVPVGDPFTARVSGMQQGLMHDQNSRIRSLDRKLTHEADGPQFLTEHLEAPEHGLGIFRSQTRCVDE